MKGPSVQLQKEGTPRRIIQSGPTSLRKRAITGSFLAILALYGLRLLAFPSEYILCSNGNGTIYTVDENNPRAECLVVRGSRIVSAGSFGKRALESCQDNVH